MMYNVRFLGFSMILASFLLMALTTCRSEKEQTVEQSTRGSKRLADHQVILYVRRGCPYCERVTSFLAKNNMKIEVKDIAQDSQADAELRKMTTKQGFKRFQVPALEIDGKLMQESLDIIEKLKEFLG